MTLIQVEGVTIDLKTAPYDARFPNVNQTKHCWQKFVDYVKCNKMLGEEAAACKEMKLHAQIICPQPWFERWNEAVEENKSPFFPPEAEEHH